jgi:hypothetical protein
MTIHRDQRQMYFVQSFFDASLTSELLNGAHGMAFSEFG